LAHFRNNDGRQRLPVSRWLPTAAPSKRRGRARRLRGNGYLRQGHPIKGLLTYGGGYAPLGDAGVVTTQPRVYLVFWGSQWGTESTSGGYQVFSGDPNGMAPFLEAFFSGLGTNNELWSATATQYCEGIATNSATCPSSAAHVPYPSGGVLAGVWEDTSITLRPGLLGSVDSRCYRNSDRAGSSQCRRPLQ